MCALQVAPCWKELKRRGTLIKDKTAKTARTNEAVDSTKEICKITLLQHKAVNIGEEVRSFIIYCVFLVIYVKRFDKSACVIVCSKFKTFEFSRSILWFRSNVYCVGALLSKRLFYTSALYSFWRVSSLLLVSPMYRLLQSWHGIE